jgi:hypothetical protein
LITEGFTFLWNGRTPLDKYTPFLVDLVPLLIHFSLTKVNLVAQPVGIALPPIFVVFDYHNDKSIALLEQASSLASSL